MAEFYYYVKKGGAALGDAGRSATKRTGSFAAMGTSAYYDSIYDVFAGGVPTTAATASDNVMVSDLHAKLHTNHRPMGMLGTIYSVDDINADTYKKGATEHVNLPGGYMDVMTTNSAYLRMHGLILKADRYFRLNRDQPQCTLIAYDCEFSVASGGFAGNLQFAGGNGVSIDLFGCAILQARSDNNTALGYGASIRLRNCTYPNATVNFINFLGAGGATVELINTDLRSVTGAVFSSVDQADDVVRVKMDRCMLTAGVPLCGSIDQEGSEITADLLAYSTDTDIQYYRRGEYYTGEYSTETAIYRTAGADYDGANGFSTEIISNVNTSFSNPLRVEIYHGYVDTADYTTAVDFKVHFAVDGSAIALNSDEVYLEIEHADGADNALGVLASTAPDPLAAGVAPTAELGLWAGLTATNKQMSINKSATIGATAGTIASGIIRAYICVAKPSQTIFACPEVVIS